MCAALNERRSDINKNKSKLKVSQYISNCVAKIIPSLKSSSKLKTDAVPIDSGSSSYTTNASYRLNSNDDQWQQANAEIPISDRIPVNITIEPPNIVTEIDPNDNNSNQAMVAAQNNTRIMSAGQNSIIPNHFNRANNALTVNNFEAQNNYNFSHINGLHIGQMYQIGAPLIANQSTRRKTSTYSLSSVRSVETITNAGNEKPKQLKSKRIIKVMECTDPLEFETLNIISTHLGENWRFIIRILGFSDGQISQMVEQNSAIGLKEVIYKFLLDWSRNEDDATIGRLCTILWEHGSYDSVIKLKDYFKKSQHQRRMENTEDVETNIVGNCDSSEANVSDEEKNGAAQKN